MKILFIAIAVFFATFASEAVQSYNDTYIASTNIKPEYIDSVEAQDMYGKKTRSFSIWGQRLSNGNYHYYAKDNYGTYNIQYADRNKYKPFYVKIGNDRWYFNSRALDRASGKTRQW